MHPLKPWWQEVVPAGHAGTPVYVQVYRHPVHEPAPIVVVTMLRETLQSVDLISRVREHVQDIFVSRVEWHHPQARWLLLWCSEGLNHPSEVRVSLTEIDPDASDRSGVRAVPLADLAAELGGLLPIAPLAVLDASTIRQAMRRRAGTAPAQVLIDPDDLHSHLWQVRLFDDLLTAASDTLDDEDTAALRYGAGLVAEQARRVADNYTLVAPGQTLPAGGWLAVRYQYPTLTAAELAVLDRYPTPTLVLALGDDDTGRTWLLDPQAEQLRDRLAQLREQATRDGWRDSAVAIGHAHDLLSQQLIHFACS